MWQHSLHGQCGYCCNNRGGQYQEQCVLTVAIDSDACMLFGCKYDFHLEGVVDCPEFLIYFPLLEKMAEKYNMKLLFTKTFHDFFREKTKESTSLLYKMKALETYPPRQEGECLVSTAEDAYTHAKDFLEGIQLNQDKSSSTSKYRDHREKNLKHVGTMSKAEWEAVGMYLAFVFVKIDPEAERKKLEEAERRAKERAEREKEREERAKAEQEKAEQEKAEQEKAEQEKAEQEKAEQEKAEKAKAEQEKEEKAEAEQETEETTEEKPQEEMETEPTEVAEETTEVESRKRKHEDDAATAEGDDDDGEPAAKKQEVDDETSG